MVYVRDEGGVDGVLWVEEVRRHLGLKGARLKKKNFLFPYSYPCRFSCSEIRSGQPFRAGVYAHKCVTCLFGLF